MLYFFRIIRIILILLRGIWISIWTLYQIALGFLLVFLIWGAIQVTQYFHLWDIRALRHINPPTTAFIEAEKADLLADKSLTDAERGIHWEWTPLDSIPKAMRDMVLVAEDGKFFSHQGFDIEQIEYALVANHQSGKPARGASTITQQVAKNLYLSGDKELSRKMREAVITLLLENYLSKERILEIYLNIAQFDRGVFGVRAAGEHYFAKLPGQLNTEEMLGLASLLPSPTQWDPRRPSRAFVRHKARVHRNYALYRGIRIPVDSSLNEGDRLRLDSLSQRLVDERWRDLRSGPYLPESEPDAIKDSTEDTEPMAAPVERVY